MPYSITEFERLYTACFPQCMGVACGLLGDEDDARDAVQDVFAKLWESGIVPASPEAFLVRSVRNACLDRLKSLSVRDRVRLGLPVELPAADEADDEERRRSVIEAVDTLLTERERQVVDRVYEQGLSYTAAAESLDVSVSLVNKCLVSAMKRLRNHFNRNKL